jgi:hypothetical protein
MDQIKKVLKRPIENTSTSKDTKKLKTEENVSFCF